MKLRALLVWLLVALLATAGVVYFLLWRDAQARVRELVQQARPVMLIRHGRVLPQPLSRTIVVYDLSAEPAGEYRRLLGTPFGYRISAAELQLHPPSPAADTGTLKLSLRGLSVPVLPSRSASMEDSMSLLDQPRPTLSELGYTALDMDASLELSHDPGTRVLSWTLGAQAPGAGNLYSELRLEIDPSDALAARFDAAKLLRLRMEWRDDGLLRRHKDASAARARLSTEGYEKALQIAMQERAQAQNWTWPAATAEALAKLIVDPSALTLRMEPLNGVELRNIGLYAPGDRFALFNLSVAVGAEHAAPAKEQAHE